MTNSFDRTNHILTTKWARKDCAEANPLLNCESNMTPQKADRRDSRSSVLYARVSSQEQAKEGFSIPAQDKLLRNYATGKTTGDRSRFH